MARKKKDETKTEKSRSQLIISLNRIDTTASSARCCSSLICAQPASAVHLPSARSKNGKLVKHVIKKQIMRQEQGQLEEK